MLGGESTSLSRSAGASSRTQFYPATIHWKTPAGALGWIWLRDTPRIDVLAAKNTLAITAIGDSIFRLCVPGLSAAMVSRDRWNLPGLIVDITTDANAYTVTPGTDYVEIEYREATRFILHTTTP